MPSDARRPRPRARDDRGSIPGGGPADVSMNTSARGDGRVAASTARRIAIPPIEWPSSRRSCSSVASATASDVGREPVEGVGGRVVGGVALAVAPVVERDDPVVPGAKRLDVVGEVLLGAAEAVHEEQRRGVVRDRRPTTASATPSSVRDDAGSSVETRHRRAIYRSGATGPASGDHDSP